MNLSHFSIRALTLLTYFLPFIFYVSTCTPDLESKQAYNAKDALNYETENRHHEIQSLETLIDKLDSQNLNDVKIELKSRIRQEFVYTDLSQYVKLNGIDRLIHPTPYSLSGIGSMLKHKNNLGKITILVSLFLSLLTFLCWRLIQKKNIAMYVLTLNLFMLLVFITDSISTKVDLLYGIWILVLLQIIQLVIEIQTKKSRSKNQLTKDDSQP